MSNRTTRQRSAVLEGLTGCQNFVSAQELHAMLSERGHRIGLTTVYRALRELAATGGADVIRDDSGERLYRRRPADGHRHYLICRACGHSRPVDSEVVEEWADRVTADTGFAAVQHTVELSGICVDCQPCPAEQSAEGGPPPCLWASARTDSPNRARTSAS